MILYEEIYFEINAKGPKSQIKKLAKFLLSGDFDDFFEISSDFISYADEFAAAADDEETEMTFTNDDIGVEVDEFDPEEFLDTFCHAAKELELVGHIYDINDEEYNFVSEAGCADFTNSRSVDKFNDELDEAADDEEVDEEE